MGSPVTVSQGAPQPGAVGPPASVVGAPHHHPGAIGPVGPGVPLGPVGPGAPPHHGAIGPVGPGVPHHHLGKRDAVALADAEAEALAEAAPDAAAHPPPPPPLIQEGPTDVSPPLCHSVPVKHCHNVPTHTPRRVARTICAVHVDITTIEDCEEVITTNCHQTSQTVAHAANVVGHDTRVGPPAVVGHHPVPALAGPIAVAGPVGPGPLIPPVAPIAPIAPGYGGPPLAPVLPPPAPLPGYSGLPIARADSPLAAFKA